MKGKTQSIILGKIILQKRKRNKDFLRKSCFQQTCLPRNVKSFLREKESNIGQKQTERECIRGGIDKGKIKSFFLILNWSKR